MNQVKQTFVIEVPTARVAAALKVLSIAGAVRDTFAASSDEAEAL